MDILLLSAYDVQRLLEPDALLDALAAAFMGLSTGAVSAPKRIEVAVPDTGFLLAMPAYQPQRAIAVKLVSVFHGNSRLGIPSHQGVVCLFDAATGTPLALMDGTYITAMRTAGAAALATRLLAREDARVLAIVGAGAQGRAHLTLLPRVRPFIEIRIASQHGEHAAQLAAADPNARAVSTAEAAIRGADVVCLCTSSREPVIHPDWLAPGAHVTSVGYAPPGGELDPTIAVMGHLFVETRTAFEPPPAGCAELAGLNPESGTELGEVLLGQRWGRLSSDEMTVYKAMGHASEDLAAASLVYRRAREAGVGTSVTL